MENFKNPPKSPLKTPYNSEYFTECEGIDLRSVRRTWVDLATSEMRLQLLQVLEPLRIGFREVEDYVSDLRLKLRSTSTKTSRECERKIVQDAMKLKLIDERQTHREITSERNKHRRDIYERFGVNSKISRSVIKYLRGEALREKQI